MDGLDRYIVVVPLSRRWPQSVRCVVAALMGRRIPSRSRRLLRRLLFARIASKVAFVTLLCRRPLLLLIQLQAIHRDLRRVHDLRGRLRSEGAFHVPTVDERVLCVAGLRARRLHSIDCSVLQLTPLDRIQIQMTVLFLVDFVAVHVGHILLSLIGQVLLHEIEVRDVGGLLFEEALLAQVVVGVEHTSVVERILPRVHVHYSVA